MNNRERFNRAMNFESVDRLPLIEWASWWKETITRWENEGLPAGITTPWEIKKHFGLDIDRQYWLKPRATECPIPEEYGKSLVSDMDSYIKIKKYLFPEDAFDLKALGELAAKQARGDIVFWITLEGFFWFSRTLFGIEEHLYAFYDHRELMHAMNQDILNYNLRMLDRCCSICKPDFMTFAEDISYNYGPMISKDFFDEFMAPYYKQIVPRLKEYGIVPIVDSDGLIDEIIPWFLEVGIEGFLPLERQAGVDVAALRRDYPGLKMIGGFDKMVMRKGESAMRAEFERLLPVMKQGGYVPSVDHQTPPEVSLENYRIYLRLLREYCGRAGGS